MGLTSLVIYYLMLCTLVIIRTKIKVIDCRKHTLVWEIYYIHKTNTNNYKIR